MQAEQEAPLLEAAYGVPSVRPCQETCEFCTPPVHVRLFSVVISLLQSQCRELCVLKLSCPQCLGAMVSVTGAVFLPPLLYSGCSFFLFLTLLFPSQLIQCDRASSGMESDCAVLPLPVAMDSQDSDPDTAAGLTSTVTSLPEDPASPGSRTGRAALVLLPMQEPVGCPLTHDQLPKTQEPEQESMVDSQPILFSENPFVVANRRGKAAGKACLGGPPLGYGQGGVLKTSLYSKASRPAAYCV